MKGPVDLPQTDVLVLESTYGDRLHPRGDVLSQLAQIVNRTFDRGGVLVIPTFAVGRAQEIIYMLSQAEQKKMIPAVPVILDSPMGAAATEILLRHPEDLAIDLHSGSKKHTFAPSKLEITQSAEESMLACMRDGPLIVLSAAGMLSGGRILHHLKKRLPGPENTVLFSGYQAEGTKGRFLQDNAGKLETLRIHHRETPIRAEILTLDALSAHGDYQDFLEWLGRSQKMPTQIYLNHGSLGSMQSFARLIAEKFGCKVTAVLKEQEFVIRK
jgi:metallo-beta-lactamase family protein